MVETTMQRKTEQLVTKMYELNTSMLTAIEYQILILNSCRSCSRLKYQRFFFLKYLDFVFGFIRFLKFSVVF